MYGKNLTFKTGGVDGCRCDEILAHIAAGRAGYRSLITHTYPLSRILEAYDLFEHRRDGVIKVAIIPGQLREKERRTMLEVGTKAPDFTCRTRRGSRSACRIFWGKKVVLYFYPRDNTPGCTRQACAFARSYSEFEGKNTVVIGVSKDSAASHLKFAQKYELPFVLLSIRSSQAIQAYGVWQEKKLYGKVSMGVVRSTYLIDEQGIIEKVMPKVKPDTNAQEILTTWPGVRAAGERHADYNFPRQEDAGGILTRFPGKTCPA